MGQTLNNGFMETIQEEKPETPSWFQVFLNWLGLYYRREAELGKGDEDDAPDSATDDSKKENVKDSPNQDHSFKVNWIKKIEYLFKHLINAAVG